MDVADVVRGLAGIEWAWAPVPVDAALKLAGWTEAGSLSYRRDYQLDGFELSSYFDDDGWSWLEIELEAREAELGNSWPEGVADEFRDRWAHTTAAVAGVLGNPAFQGHPVEPGFPVDQNANWAAVWVLPTARFLITQTHEGKEFPYCVSLQCTPPDVPDWMNLYEER
ncbi:hypothetical protein [Actinoplanes regularis]|uniref:hypothetical protein n=1 Tax=Actinoplanes regularis TaxID=52697 RepID=UPI0024A3B0DE|nr:hypothetical protein [Actinoplanes regularis]GLW35255.1 hypothetical protein Areg01_81910 [Actinoplanes regularis]